MGSDGHRIHGRHDDARIGNLRRVSAISTNDADHRRFPQERQRYLFHRHPCYIIDQLLLCPLIDFEPGFLLTIAIGIFQLLLEILLSRHIRTSILNVVHVVIGYATVKLTRQPVLWIRIFCNPRESPEL